MIIKALKFSFISLLLLNMSSCIENDIPYPYIEGVIQEIQVDGMQGEAVFNNQARTIELTIGEDVFIDSLPITRLVANSEALIYPDTAACIKPNGFPNFSFASLNELPGNANTAVDFTNPVGVLLKTYQEYWWKITVKQEIERVIEVENQSGTAPSLDLYNHVAIIYVTEDADYRNIKIKKLNLEGSKTVLDPDPATVTDFTRPRVFKAYRNGRYICDWTVDVQKSSVAASVEKVNAWATKAYISGSFRAGTDISVEYRVKGNEEWTKLDNSAITETGSTSYSAELTGLQSGTDYEVRALAGGSEGDVYSFQTETIVTLPNMNFETWTQDGKTWYPNSVADNYDNLQAYWATGNQGVTSVGNRDSNVIPVEGTDAYKGKAVKMQTIEPMTLVGAAAGNIFIGKYKTNVGNPASSPSFGRPYSGARPTKLSGYYKYKPMPISNDGTVPGNLKTDQCHIYFKLWNASGQEIAYGEFIGTETVTEYTKFEFDIEYSDTESKPATITIVATSSKYGGEFQGMKVVGQVGSGSTLWVDEFELGYE